MLIEKCQQIARDILNDLGSGFDESVYQKAFEVSLRLENIRYENQRVIPIFYRGFNIGDSRLDLIAYEKEERLLIELKALSSSLSPKEETQLKKYMALLNMPTGLLINFSQAGRSKSKETPLEPEIIQLPKV